MRLSLLWLGRGKSLVNRHSLLIRNWIGKETNWNQKDNTEAFLKAFVAEVEPNAQVEVTSEPSDAYTLHLSMGNKKTRISVYYEELVNCNSSRLSEAEESQKELAEKICSALGDIARQHRKLGFIK
jgi:hypothetical protein